MRWPLFICAIVVGGCAAPQFADEPVVWRLTDRRDIPEPETNRFSMRQYLVDVLVTKRIDRGLSLSDPEEAHDVNALDEVPNSTWFENRIGARAIAPERIARGPGGPAPTPPLTITGSKSSGSNIGFRARDAEGRAYLVKLDEPGSPEMQTAAAAISSRLFWAMGYHVPSEHVFTFDPDQLRIEAGATQKNAIGDELPFTRADLDELLAPAPRSAGGKLRAIGSLLLDGTPKGGFRPWGTRPDDPNDTIPHQHRRTLRGLRVFCAWTDHADINEDNTLDTYVTEGGRSFLRHHLVDFGETLGALFPERNWPSYAHTWDWKYNGLAIFTLGLWKRPWEDEPPSPHPSIGPLFGARFDPKGWRETKPFLPFFAMTEADAFWAAKIVLRFRQSHIRAAVRAGQLSSEDAADYLVETLVARRDAIGRAYVAAMTSVDRFEIERGALCMTDLAVRYGLVEEGRIEARRDGGWAGHDVGPRGRICLPISDDPYQVLELRSVRGTERFEPIEVHVKGGPQARVLGVIRDADFG